MVSLILFPYYLPQLYPHFPCCHIYPDGFLLPSVSLVRSLHIAFPNRRFQHDHLENNLFKIGIHFFRWETSFSLDTLPTIEEREVSKTFLSQEVEILMPGISFEIEAITATWESFRGSVAMVPVAKFPTAFNWLKDRFLSFHPLYSLVDLLGHYRPHCYTVLIRIGDCHLNPIVSHLGELPLFL